MGIILLGATRAQTSRLAYAKHGQHSSHPFLTLTVKRSLVEHIAVLAEPPPPFRVELHRAEGFIRITRARRTGIVPRLHLTGSVLLFDVGAVPELGARPHPAAICPTRVERNGLTILLPRWAHLELGRP